MKRQLLIRIPTVFLTVAMLFTTVFSLSMFANAAGFTSRTTAPDYSNSYYYSNKNIFYQYGYGMPNCTAYAYGRAYEILGKQPSLCIYGAGEWYDYNRNGGYYSYGNTPKLGAIACWSYSGGGHVAVVEKIEGTSMTLSNSEWGGRSFYLTTAKTTDSNPGGNSWWTFQGYIYIIDSADEPTNTVTYEAGVYKTNVDSWLNMRSGAGTGYSTVASIPNGVSLNVTEVQSAGGYTWGYTSYNGKNGWVALEFCDYVSELPVATTAAPTTQPTTAAPTTEPTTAEPATTAPVTQPATAEITTEPVTEPTTEAPETQPATVENKGLGVGDVNSDGIINIADATEIQRVVAGYSCSEEKRRLCDVDFSGEVTINDATILQRYIAYTQTI